MHPPLPAAMNGAADLLGEKEGAAQIDVHQRVPLVRRDIDRELAQIGAGIVDQQIEPAQARR